MLRWFTDAKIVHWVAKPFNPQLWQQIKAVNNSLLTNPNNERKKGKEKKRRKKRRKKISKSRNIISAHATCAHRVGEKSGPLFDEDLIGAGTLVNYISPTKHSDCSLAHQTTVWAFNCHRVTLISHGRIAITVGGFVSVSLSLLSACLLCLSVSVSVSQSHSVCLSVYLVIIIIDVLFVYILLS